MTGWDDGWREGEIVGWEVGCKGGFAIGCLDGCLLGLMIGCKWFPIRLTAVLKESRLVVIKVY